MNRRRNLSDLPRTLAGRRGARRLTALMAAGLISLSACGSSDSGDTSAATVEVSADTSADTSSDAGSDTVSATETASASSTSLDLGAVGSLSSAEVHEISIDVDEDELIAMLDTYASTGDKEWIEATVTVDGVTYEQVGIRLKGNSSLRGATSASDPTTLPWLVKLDKYVEDQSADGLTEFVVRSSSSATALNEAVALELLSLAGLASQDAIATAFSVNGSDAVLRLVIDNPDDTWMAEELGDDGALYKAESTGDYSYRGDDPESYTDVFDQEAGEDDLTPLIEFLDFVNNSDDATFAAELADRLDVEAFARYLAFQEIIDNFDDIDGPGNNSYLYADPDTGLVTVVAWDHNLAFGQRPGGTGGGMEGGMEGGVGGMPGGPGGGQAPPDMGDVGGMGGGMPGGGMGGSNVLVTRFLAVDEFSALVDDAVADLTAELYDSGTASAVLDAWSDIVSSSGLVDQTTVDSEAAAIETYF